MRNPSIFNPSSHKRSVYKYPDSDEFKASIEARKLAQKLAKRNTGALLDADVQAMLKDVNSQSEMRSYYSKGKMRCDEAIQAGEVPVEFKEMEEIYASLRDVILDNLSH